MSEYGFSQEEAQKFEIVERNAKLKKELEESRELSKKLDAINKALGND